MKNKILAGLGVLIGIMVLGGIFSSPSKPEVAGTKVEKIIVTPSPTPTPTLTSTPTPTLTPTPTPTFVPTPKPTPRPTPSPVVQAPATIIDAGCGTYINSAGNEVARPCPANDVPEGATARCGDGTYSYSQSRRGTCSHHGGVAEWL